MARSAAQAQEEIVYRRWVALEKDGQHLHPAFLHLGHHLSHSSNMAAILAFCLLPL